MSSSGIRAFLAIMRAIKEQNKTLVLFNMPANVRKIFDIVEIDHLFEIFDTEASAIARLA